MLTPQATNSKLVVLCVKQCTLSGYWGLWVYQRGIGKYTEEGWCCSLNCSFCSFMVRRAK
jgi:hypothetical protein